MNDQNGLLTALLAVFAGLAAAMLLLIVLFVVLHLRHTRRRGAKESDPRTLTTGDLFMDDKLAQRFRREAETLRHARAAPGGRSPDGRSASG